MGASISQNIQPTQRAALAYQVNASIPASLANKTSFTVLGRELGNPGASAAAAAGAIVAAYLNCSVYVNSGTYHNFLYSTASGTPAFTQYPSGGTSYGLPIDYTIISDANLAAKYDATIRKIKHDFPFINAMFLDDCGPDWAGYGSLSGTARETFYLKHVRHRDQDARPRRRAGHADDDQRLVAWRHQPRLPGSRHLRLLPLRRLLHRAPRLG